MLYKMLNKASNTKRNGKKISNRIRRKAKRLKRLYEYKERKDKKKKDIYIITFDDLHYKIGVTDKIEDRIKSIQTGSPYKLKVKILSNIKFAFEVENFMHLYFHHQNTYGEWYRLDDENIRIANNIINLFSMESN